MLLEELRSEVIDYARQMAHSRLTSGTWGNVSARDRETGLIAITPSGMDYDSLTPADIVIIDEHGKIVDGHRRPSVETELHTIFMRNRLEVGSVVHTHSPFATALGIARDEIPIALAELAAVVGSAIPVAPYVTLATAALAETAYRVMGDGRAVVLRNHGVVAIGETLKDTLAAAAVIEENALVYWLAYQIGEPSILPREEVQKLRCLYLRRYGQGNSKG